MSHTPTTAADSLFDGLDIPHERDVPLGPLTWYGVGGNAAVLAHPESVEQLSALAKRCHERGVPMRVLGSGANLLVADRGVDGVVVQLDAPAFSQLTQTANRLIVGSGYDLMKLVLEAARRGLAGLEVVAGIPASGGGAVRMNAGGAFGDVGSCVGRVRVMSKTGEIYDRRRDDLIFSYRHTNIAAPIILEVEFELSPQEPDHVMKRVKEIFMYKKTTQPMAERSAGCAFKNPQNISSVECRMSNASDIQDAASDASHAACDMRHATSLSAGALIDQAGLKGYRVGGAEVSDKHANFIFTHEGCAADDVLAVMDHVQQVVLDKFGIALEREVVVWP